MTRSPADAPTDPRTPPHTRPNRAPASFIDARGVRWSVVEVGERPGGWLLFTSASAETWRLGPIPSGWALLPVQGLRRLLGRASPDGAPAAGVIPSAAGSPAVPTLSPAQVAGVEQAWVREREGRLLAEVLLGEAKRRVRALESELAQARAELAAKE